MKKLFFLFLPFLLGTFAYSPAEAQKFRMGCQAGINGSQIWGDQMRGFDKGGLLAGVFVDINYWEKFNLSFELNYTEKGSMKNKSYQTNGTWNSFKISYLEVPLIANYKIGKGFDINGALALGFKVGQKYTDNSGNENNDLNFTKAYDASAFLGVNYHFSKSFLVQVRIESSFITIGKGKSNPFWAKTNTGLINIVASCSIRYYFPFK